LSASGTVAVIFLFCLVACAAVLASKAFDSELITLITVICIVACLVLTRLFGHAEAMLIKGRLAALLNSTNMPHQMEVRLQGTVSWDNLWQALKNEATELKLKGMLLDVNAPFMHEGYYANWGKAGEGEDNNLLWHMTIPIIAQKRSLGRLVLSGQPDEQPMWGKIAAMMRVIEEFNAEMDVGGIPESPTAAPAAPPSPHPDVALETVKS
jgi:UDP-GlcNAc:undecaprenyl-phosphate GlcNAc-1-phosphate transferase